MNEQTTRYRFSLRDLFFFILACSLLLFEWKMWGIASLLGTLMTLVCGVVFVWFFATRAIQNSWRVTLNCILLSAGNFILLPVLSMGTHNQFTGLGVAFFSLLMTTALIIGMLQLIIKPNWSLWFPLIVAFNCWFGCATIYVVTDRDDSHVGQTFGADLLRGYATAMLVCAIALLLRWVKSLPTSRDDLAQ